MNNFFDYILNCFKCQSFILKQALANGQLVDSKMTFEGRISKAIGSRYEEATSLDVEIDTAKMTCDGTLRSGDESTYNFKVRGRL